MLPRNRPFRRWRPGRWRGASVLSSCAGLRTIFRQRRGRGPLAVSASSPNGHACAGSIPEIGRLRRESSNATASSGQIGSWPGPLDRLVVSQEQCATGVIGGQPLERKRPQAGSLDRTDNSFSTEAGSATAGRPAKRVRQALDELARVDERTSVRGSRCPQRGRRPGGTGQDRGSTGPPAAPWHVIHMARWPSTASLARRRCRPPGR